MKPVGVGKASTFTGFCGYHDSSTFAPLEKVSFVGSSEQCFLLMYRVICREIYMKTANRANALDTIAKIKGLPGYNALSDMFKEIVTGADAGLRELSQYKQLYDAMLQAQNYSKVRYYVAFLDGNPEVVTAGGFQPEFDFAGRRLQHLAEMKWLLHIVTFSIIATETGVAAIFAWADDANDSAEALVRSFHALPDYEKPHAAVRLAFDTLENTFVSPDWWDALDKETQQGFEKRMLTGVKTLRTAEGLKDDGIRAITQKFASYSTNLIL